MTHDPFHPVHRPRRLRTSPGLRNLVAETRLHPAELVLPVFVAEGAVGPRPIASLPGIVQHSKSSLVDAVQEASDLGVGAVMVFGVPLAKDARGTGALDPDGILAQAVRVVAVRWRVRQRDAAYIPTRTDSNVATASGSPTSWTCAALRRPDM